MSHREVLLKNTEPVNKTSNSKRNYDVCFDGFMDSRPDSTIGHVQNGYGIRTADVKAINNVPDWINNEIKVQLKMAGYSVNENCMSERNGKIELQGKIVKVYTTAYMSYLGEVSIEANISLDSSLVIKKIYSGYNKGGANFTASANVFGGIIEKSLKSVTAQLINDIDSIDSGYLNVDNRVPETINQVQSSIKPDSGEILPEVTNVDLKSDKVDCPGKKNGIVIESGKRSLSSIKYALDNIKIKLKSVYNDRFELNQSLSGSICVNFSISSDGKVSNVRILRNSLQDKPIEEKLIDLLAKHQFKKISEEEPTMVSYNLQFDKKSAKSSKGVIASVIAILAFVPIIIVMVNIINNPSNTPYR